MFNKLKYMLKMHIKELLGINKLEIELLELNKEILKQHGYKLELECALIELDKRMRILSKSTN